MGKVEFFIAVLWFYWLYFNECAAEACQTVPRCNFGSMIKARVITPPSLYSVLSVTTGTGSE